MRKAATGIAMLVALAGCQGRNDERGSNAQSPMQDASGADTRVECESSGSADFTSDCTVTRTETVRGLILTISHPDGHFRRLLVTTDGRGVIAADGAQPAKVTILDPKRIEVALAGDRYRLPAHLGSSR